MQIPRSILITFLALVVGGTLLGTALLVSSTEAHLGETIVMTPAGTSPTPTPPQTSQPATPTPTSLPEIPQQPAPPAPPSPNGAIEVPACAPLTGDDDCDDDWEDYWDDYWDELDDD